MWGLDKQSDYMQMFSMLRINANVIQNTEQSNDVYPSTSTPIRNPEGAAETIVVDLDISAELATTTGRLNTSSEGTRPVEILLGKNNCCWYFVNDFCTCFVNN